MDELSIILLCVGNELNKKGIDIGTKVKTLAEQCRTPNIDETIDELKRQLTKVSKNPETTKLLTSTIDEVRQPKTDYIAAKEMAYKGNLRISWDQQQRYIAAVFGRQPQAGEVYILIEKSNSDNTAQIICYGLTHYRRGEPNPHVFAQKFNAEKQTAIQKLIALVKTPPGLSAFVETAYHWEGALLLGAEQGEINLFEAVTKIYIKAEGKIQEITL